MNNIFDLSGKTAIVTGASTGLGQGMSLGLAQAGADIVLVAPGYMATNNTKALREDPDRSKSILDRIPAGRWGLPSDLASVAVFLASHASDYVNGHVLAVDGGWLAR